MPIRRELRDLYPDHWRASSAGGSASNAPAACAKAAAGRTARWPDLEQMVRLRTTRVVLAAAHLDHDTTNNRLTRHRAQGSAVPAPPRLNPCTMDRGARRRPSAFPRPTRILAGAQFRMGMRV
jgi:hypothetical protein